MKSIVFAILLSFLLLSQSCSRKVITQTHTVYDTTSVVVRERVVDTLIERDTISQLIEIGCDSLNKPFVKGTGVKAGKRSNLYTSFDNNRMIHILSDCKEAYIRLLAQDSIIRKQTVEIKEYKAIVEKKPTISDYLKMIGLHILYVAAVVVLYELIRKIVDRYI